MVDEIENNDKGEQQTEIKESDESQQVLEKSVQEKLDKIFSEPDEDDSDTPESKVEDSSDDDVSPEKPDESNKDDKSKKDEPVEKPKELGSGDNEPDKEGDEPDEDE
ncbi:MAG: hypothetical protein ABIH23_22055, partial [bacterium]